MARAKFYSVYITASGKAEAERIGRMLVTRRLAACVNIYSGMKSIYRWKGKIESAREAVVIAKTRGLKVDALIRAVKSVHSYDLPCIIAWPIAKGEAGYLKWIGAETGR